MIWTIELTCCREIMISTIKQECINHVETANDEYWYNQFHELYSKEWESRRT